MTDEQKAAAVDALKEGIKDGYEASKTNTSLAWWERILWAILAGIASAATALLTPSCTVDYTQSAAGDAAFRGVVVLPINEDCGK